jgi:phosphodiesterase/alkaline phosphatase D-like protein
MIDDHEVVNDFAGGALRSTDARFLDESGTFINDTRYYQDGLQAFQEYWPLRTETWESGSEPRFAGKPRLYRHQTFGSDAAIFMVDARSFRDAPLGRVMSRNIWDIGAFLFAAATPGRQMLGRTQLDRLEADLMAAQQAGVVWKFVFVPQPIQNLGVIAANDRYEGYAAERSALLGFIHERRIENVVFVTADFHGTLVNNLAYSWYPLTPANRASAWEIITGPVAVDTSLGAGIAAFAAKASIISAAQKRSYDEADRAGKDRFIAELIDRQVQVQFLDPLGLADAGLGAVLEVGSYTACHSFGWTEFEVDGASLVVTTYGVDSYAEGDLASDPAAVLARVPQVVQRFRVRAAAGGG